MKTINLLAAFAIVAALSANPANERPPPPLDLAGRWEGHTGRGKAYDVHVVEQQNATISYWRDSEGWISYIGTFTKNADGSWTETYAESAALNRCSPWTWKRNHDGTMLIDANNSWRLIRPQAVPPLPEPDFAARGQCGFIGKQVNGLRIHLVGEDPAGPTFVIDLPQFAPAMIGGKIVEPVCVVPGLRK